MTSAADHRHMRHALTLARRSLGLAWPNPAVGCVIVSSRGIVVGRGWTAHGGRPHAETLALAQAGSSASGATAYVTLEPCSHFGVTPPCAEALVVAGIARVVAAHEDPDPRVRGAGLARLRDAGIVVDVGVGAAEAGDLNRGFLLRVRQGRPLVALKIAQSIDGGTATAAGDSKWITGDRARRIGHFLRAQYDAILVGIGTVCADDPELTCRLPGLGGRSPLRVVLDTRLKLQPGARLAVSAKSVPTVVYTLAEGGNDLRACGVQVVKVRADPRGRPSIEAVLADLAARGVTRLLVEGGAEVHASFLDRGLADRLEIFVGPVLFGGAGHRGIGALASLTLSESPRFRMTEERPIGGDVLLSYTRED